MSDHVSCVCLSALAALRRIGWIRPFLNSVTCARLVHALVTSRIDSWNSILFGLPLHGISILQIVQNTAARLAARISRYEHITPVHKTLHWLPIKQYTKCLYLLTRLITVYHLFTSPKTSCFTSLVTIRSRHPNCFLIILVSHPPNTMVIELSLLLLLPLGTICPSLCALQRW